MISIFDVILDFNKEDIRPEEEDEPTRPIAAAIRQNPSAKHSGEEEPKDSNIEDEENSEDEEDDDDND